MARIEINIDGLYSSANKMNKHCANLQDLNKRFKALLQRMDSSWEGEANEAYITMMNGFAEKLTVYESAVSEFKEYAKNAADQFSELDNSSAQRIRNSF